jgi:hypothetical protein
MLQYLLKNVRLLFKSPKKVSLFVCFLSLFSSTAFSSPQEWEMIKKTSPQNTPKYFFRPVPGTPYISYTSGTRNRLLNMETGEEVKIPHWVDAVPTPIGNVITIPRLVPNFSVKPRFGFIPEFGTMEFYHLDNLLKGKAKPFFRDRKLPGAYQTIAVLKKTPHSTLFRIVTESFLNKKRVFLQDYEVLFNQNKVSSMKALYPKAKRFCPNIEISLPMLSKTGKFFAAVDPLTRHMKIYTMDKNFNCQLHKDLEMPTGKVDFSYDDRFVAFHVSPINPTDVAHVVKTQKLGNNIDIMIYDLHTESLNWVSDCQKSNCYYPSFNPQGELYYIEQRKNKSYQFVKLKRK